jgi:hypothetical protein
MRAPCGVEFPSAEFLKAHPEYAWQAPLLEDLKANPWIVVSAATSRETASASGQ